mmetsp:Transcript_64511/g.197372  ORF Transcript_64511/g.197372 Transcript_64511/m.197372 type:complete len:666 (-) Transcript_64511:1145-3142(-)
MGELQHELFAALERRRLRRGEVAEPMHEVERDVPGGGLAVLDDLPEGLEQGTGRSFALHQPPHVVVHFAVREAEALLRRAREAAEGRQALRGVLHDEAEGLVVVIDDVASLVALEFRHVLRHPGEQQLDFHDVVDRKQGQHGQSAVGIGDQALVCLPQQVTVDQQIRDDVPVRVVEEFLALAVLIGVEVLLLALLIGQNLPTALDVDTVAEPHLAVDVHPHDPIKCEHRADGALVLVVRGAAGLGLVAALAVAPYAIQAELRERGRDVFVEVLEGVVRDADVFRGAFGDLPVRGLVGHQRRYDACGARHGVRVAGQEQRRRGVHPAVLAALLGRRPRRRHPEHRLSVVVLLLRLLHVAVVVHAAPLDRLLHGHAQHAVLLARFDVVAVEPAPVRDDHVLRFRALDFLAAREGEVRAGRQADVQLGAGVQDLHADLIHLVHRLQARIRPRVAHLLGELVRGPVDVHVRRQEIHGEAETGEQRLVHRLSPLLIDAHPHGDRLGQVHLLVGALLPLSPDDEHVVYVQNLRVHPHLDDADGPAQIAEDDIQGRAHRDMHLVVQLGEGLGGELGHVDAVFVQQAHELVLLAVDDGLPAPRRLADLELLPLRQADALELLVGLVLDVDDYVVRLVRRHDPRDGLGCGALLLEPVAVVVDVEAQSLHPRGDA